MCLQRIPPVLLPVYKEFARNVFAKNSAGPCFRRFAVSSSRAERGRQNGLGAAYIGFGIFTIL